MTFFFTQNSLRTNFEFLNLKISFIFLPTNEKRRWRNFTCICSHFSRKFSKKNTFNDMMMTTIKRDRVETWKDSIEAWKRESELFFYVTTNFHHLQHFHYFFSCFLASLLPCCWCIKRFCLFNGFFIMIYSRFLMSSTWNINLRQKQNHLWFESEKKS